MAMFAVMTSNLPPRQRTAPRPSRAARIVGAVLVVPAVVLVLVDYALPAARTVTASFQRCASLARDCTWAGSLNYRLLLIGPGEGVPTLLARGFLAAGVVAVLGAAGGAMIGMLAGGSRRMRIAARVLIAAVLAGVTPVGMALGHAQLLRAPDDATAATVAVAVATFAPALAGLLGAVLMAVPGGPVRALPVIGAAMVVVTGAGGLQLTALGYVGGGRLEASGAVLRWLVSAEFGGASAISVIMLVLLAVLGLGATVLMIITVRLTVVPPAVPHPAPNTRPRAGATVGLLAVALIAVAALLAALPWLSATQPAIPGMERPLTPSLIATGAALGGTAIQTVVALAAGIGIGWFRPLGARSRWLLLIFAPFLLVGVVPLGIAWYLPARAAGSFDTLPALLGPSALCCWMIMVVALAAEAARESSDRYGRFIAAAVAPLAGVIGAAVVLLFAMRWQEFVWPLLMIGDTDLWPDPLWTLKSWDAVGLAGVLPFPVWLVIAAGLAAALVGADRVRVVVGVSGNPGRAEFPAGRPARSVQGGGPGGAPAAVTPRSDRNG